MNAVRGWCPSAHRPMQSGDGLLVRVKPRLGRLSAAEVLTLCDLAARYSNGMIDLTSRANLQIRGVLGDDHPALLAELVEEGLVDANPCREERRNIAVTPFHEPGDLTDRLHEAIVAVLDDLPDLPGKMGITVDPGPAPVLTGVSGDFRFERAECGALILRAEGAALGRPVSEFEATVALTEMAEWFIASGGRESGRMGRHLKRAALPKAWQIERPCQPASPSKPGGETYGVPFGRTTVEDLRMLIAATGASHLRVTPWRTLVLDDAAPEAVDGYLSFDDPLLAVAACPGAPACAQGQVGTREIARALAGKVGSLHVSGCAKGCARQKPSDVTLVGNDGRFDLVRGGRAGDTPERSGLTEAEVLELFA